MNLALELLLSGVLLQGAPDVQTEVAPEVAEAVEATPQVEPYSGNLSEGIAEVAALTMEDKYDESLVLSERLLAPNVFLQWRRQQKEADSFAEPLLDLVDPGLDWLGLLGPPAEQRAEIHYARGVVLMRRGKADENGQLRDASGLEYQSSRSLAGAGELRNASVYNLGVGWLEEAERVRLEIPEIRQKLGLPELPAAAPSPQDASTEEEEAPDPLEVARGFYVNAREHFVERLRLDWRDENTRANVELVQRRLRELDEIEKQREEQEQEQDDEESEDSEDSEESEESEDEQEKSEDQDESEESDEQENSEDQEEPSDEQDPENPEEEEPEEPEEPDPGEGEEQEEPEPAKEGEPEERTLTREEVMRLLEQLKQIEEEAEKVQEQLRDKRRVKVKRDW